MLKMNIKINLTTIVLCLGLAGYMSATDGIYAKTPSVEQETQKMEVTIPVEYNTELGGWNWSSPYSVSTIATSVSSLTHKMVKAIFPDEPGFFMRLIRVPVEMVGVIGVNNYTFSYFKPEEDKFPVLDRLIMLQHFKYRKLDWPLYWLASFVPISSSSYGDITYNDELWNCSMIFCGIYAILYNYLFRGKNATMLPHWGSISYMPCFRILLSSTTNKKLNFNEVTPEFYNLDNYIGYGDRTFLIGVSVYEDDSTHIKAGKVFLKTDRLLSFKGGHTGEEVGKGGHTVDIEVGIGWKYKSNRGKELLGLFGLQGTFRLHEYCSLKAAISYKTRDFEEGITASGNGWTLSGGITLHI